MSAKYEWPLRLAIFLDLVGFGMTFPDVQLRAQGYGAPGWLIGVVLASYYLVQMTVSPVWGRWSDRVGRKPVLVLCGALSAGSMVIYALGHDVTAMLLSRLTAGLGAANVVVAQAYITDAAAPDSRAPALARMGAAVSAGLVVGPGVGGLLAEAGGNFLLGMTAATASGLGALWILLAVPRRAPTEPVAVTVKRRRAWALLRDNGALARLFAVALAGWFALACLEGTFGRLLQHNLGYGQREYGLLLSLDALVAVVQGVFYARLARRVAPGPLLRGSYLLQALGLGLIPFAPNFALLVLLSVLFGLGLGAAMPTINSEASALTPDDRQGEIFGLLQSSRAFGFLFGPIAGGLLFDWRPAAPYLLAGAVMVVAALAAPRRTAAS